MRSREGWANAEGGTRRYTALRKVARRIGVLRFMAMQQVIVYYTELVSC